MKCKKCGGFGRFILPHDIDSNLASPHDKYMPCPECSQKTTSKLYCRHCKEEVIGSKNQARVYYEIGDMDSIEDVYLVHEGCLGKFLGKPGMNYERGSGEIVCAACDRGVRGSAVIDYIYDSDYVEDYIIVHSGCVNRYQAKKKGYTHPCPKCETSGIHPQGDKCDLCFGFGFLEKPPVPLTKITEWKRG